MRERHVPVPDILEEVHLVAIQQQARRDRMHRRVTPPLVEEAAVFVQRLEEIRVCLRPEPVQTADLEVRPEVAMVVAVPLVVAEPRHTVVLGDVLRELAHEFLRRVPDRGDGLDVFVQTQHETVLLLVLRHEAERIEVDVAEYLHARLHPPVPLVILQQRLPVKEPRFEAAHVPVADRVAVDDLLLGHLFADLLGFFLVDPFRERPMFFGDFAVVRGARDEGRGDFLEGVVEGFVVEEDPVVVVVAVESVFDAAD